MTRTIPLRRALGTLVPAVAAAALGLAALPAAAVAQTAGYQPVGTVPRVVDYTTIPNGVAVDRSTGQVYVAGNIYGDVQVFSPDGTRLRSFGDFAFDAVTGALALDPAARRIYTTDYFGARITAYDLTGRRMFTVGRGGRSTDNLTDTRTGVLSYPTDVAVAGNGDLYVADFQHSRVQVFSRSGSFLRQFAAGGRPQALAVAPTTGTVAVATEFGVRLVSPTGAVRRTLASSIAGGPVSVAVDARTGAVLVSEGINGRIAAFAESGQLLSTTPLPSGTATEQSADLATGADGTLFVGDPGRDRVVAYRQP